MVAGRRYGRLEQKLTRSNLRLLLLLVIPVLLIALGINVRMLREQLALTRESALAALVTKGTTLVQNNSMALSGYVQDYAINDVRDLLSQTRRSDEDVQYSMFADSDGHLWVHATATNPTGEVIGSNVMSDELSKWAQALDTQSQSNTLDPQLVEFASPVMGDEKKLGVVRYGLRSHSLQQRLDDAQRHFIEGLMQQLTAILLVTLIVALLGWWGLRRVSTEITRPLQSLTAASASLAAGDYGQVVEVQTGDELEALAQSFNKMAKDLGESHRTLEEMNNTLEIKVRERTKRIEEMQQELLTAAHKAGMAEIATDILHNIGNVLNSVKASHSACRETVRNSWYHRLLSANKLLAEHIGDVTAFVTNNPKAKTLFSYYLALGDQAELEHGRLSRDLDRIEEKISLITQIISLQQQHARAEGLRETVTLEALFSTVLMVHQKEIENANIQVKIEGAVETPIVTQKSKLTHIIINLIKNGIEAMVDSSASRVLQLRAREVTAGSIDIEVEDSGVGIPAELLTRIFNHGFTTKPSGSGFGLHSCATWAVELGGELSVHSEGVGKGAIFTIRIPFDNGSK